MFKIKKETAVGIFVVMGLLAVVYMSVKLGNVQLFSDKYYDIKANFTDISGLKVNAPVQMYGVEIGFVSHIGLDQEKGVAAVTMMLLKEVELTDDAIAAIKTNGLIVDFVGIFDNLERALAFDSHEVEGVVEGLDVLKERFEHLMARGRCDFLPLSSGKSADKAAEAVLEHFRDRERREAFYAYFRELEEVYEILSPHPFLRPFLKDYQTLVEMYRLLRSAYEPHVPVDKSFLRKTAGIVQKHTATGAIQEPQATYEIGVGALLALLKQQKPDTVKVFNLLKELHRLVEAKGKEQPHLIPIGERAEAIRQAFEERQLSSQQALAELDKLVQQLREAETERRQSELSPEAFAVAWWLRVQKGLDSEKAEALAISVEPAFKEFPHWAVSETQERGLRRRLYRELIQADVKDLVAWTDEMLKLLRRAAE